jgi:hypothetical protein
MIWKVVKSVHTVPVRDLDSMMSDKTESCKAGDILGTRLKRQWLWLPDSVSIMMGSAGGHWGV